MIQNILAELIVAFITMIITNLDRIIASYRRRRSFYKPEYEIRRGEIVYIVTSSRDFSKKPPDAPEDSLDNTVIGDMKPILVALRDHSFDVRHFLPERFPDYLYDDNIISFGGEVSNSITTYLLDQLRCPLRFDDYAIVDEIDKAQYTINRDSSGRLVTDYGLIVKAPNPNNPKAKIVYVFAGIHKPGTLGATLCTLPKYEGLMAGKVRRMKAFAALVKIRVAYLGPGREDEPIVTPERIVRVHDLSR